MVQLKSVLVYALWCMFVSITSIIAGNMTVSCGTTTSIQSPPAPLSIKIALEWFLNPHHAPLIIAHANGYFADEGLVVDFCPLRGSQEGCLQANQGSVACAITHEPQIHIMNAKGIHLEMVAVLIPNTIDVILSNVALAKSSHFKTFTDSDAHPLLGKIIAHDSSGNGSLTFAIMHQFLKSQRLTENDVTIIMAKNSIVNGFIAGKIDVVFNIYKTYQIHDIKKHTSMPFFVYELKDFGVPPFASMVLACGKSLPQNVRDKIVRGLQKAMDFIHQSPVDAYECVRRYRPELDTIENKEVWPSVHAVFAKDVRPRDIGGTELISFLKNAKIIDQR